MRSLLRRVKRAGASCLRSVGRRLVRVGMARRSREWRSEDLGRPAVVFAPHQDDEVLGCGGTILRKRRAGADVAVVFMTDGSASHPDLMPAGEMKRLRAAEARAACGRLGVSEDRVFFLDFQDGHLGRQLDVAVPRVIEILRLLRPDEVFIPHHQDGPPDHLATTAAVLAALLAEGRRTTVYEYPVWLWCHWPWIGLPGNLSERLESLWQSTRANWSLVRDCRCIVPIGDILDLKLAALDQHQSQVRRLIADPRWSTLGDVFNGEFLACFFRDREIFYRYTMAVHRTK